MRRKAVWLLALLPVFVPLAAFALAELRPSPQRVEFSSRCVRTEADPRRVRMINDGNRDAKQIEVKVSPTTVAPVFPLSGRTFHPRLEAGQSFSFFVGFVPQKAGEQTGTAVVEYLSLVPSSSAKPSPSPVPRRTLVPLSGGGIDRWVDTSPRSLNLGTVRVGRRGQTKTLRVFDDGDSPLTIHRITVGGRHPGDFRVVPRGSATIRDGDPLEVQVRFDPEEAGARAAVIRVHTNACGADVVEVPVGGLAVEPDVALFPEEIDLGSRKLGQPRSIVAKVANIGGWPLRVSWIRFTDPNQKDFELRGLPKLPLVLRPGRSAHFDVRFTAAQPGQHQAVIEVLSNDPDRKRLRADVRGKAVAPATLSPTPITSAPAVPDDVGGGSGLPFSRYVAELATSGAVIGFFLVLMLIRRLKGAPE